MVLLEIALVDLTEPDCGNCTRESVFKILSDYGVRRIAVSAYRVAYRLLYLDTGQYAQPCRLSLLMRALVALLHYALFQ